MKDYVLASFLPPLKAEERLHLPQSRVFGKFPGRGSAVGKVPKPRFAGIRDANPGSAAVGLLPDCRLPWINQLVRRWAWIPAELKIANAFIHIGGSLLYRRWMAGILSSPLLLLTGGWLLWSSQR